MIDFLKGTVGKDYFSSAWVGWELELNGRLKELPSIPCINAPKPIGLLVDIGIMMSRTWA